MSSVILELITHTAELPVGGEQSAAARLGLCLRRSHRHWMLGESVWRLEWPGRIKGNPCCTSALMIPNNLSTERLLCSALIGDLQSLGGPPCNFELSSPLSTEFREVLTSLRLLWRQYELASRPLSLWPAPPETLGASFEEDDGRPIPRSSSHAR